jgi:hypothetical protein
MENTNTIQFADDQPSFFISVDDKFRGPFKASEVYEKLQSKELSWIDYIYREKEGAWLRIADHETFKSLQAEPPKPKPMMPPKVAAPPPPPKKVEDDIKWFLFQNDTQTGPYPTTELSRLIGAGQILATAYVWHDKFTDWKPYQEVTELSARSSGAPSAPQPAHVQAPVAAKAQERRAGPRKPLVAEIYLTNLSELMTGICRDISIGGMQVLTDKIPGEVGKQIRLNISPPATSGLKPFVAEGVIVRVLEDHRGFSFRFSTLTPEAKAAIESYIA